MKKQYCRTARILLLFLSFIIFQAAHSQLIETKKKFTHADTLRGSLGPARTWWDVTGYRIQVKPDYAAKSISGKVILSFRVLQTGSQMQIDLQEPMVLISALYRNNSIPFTRDSNAYFLRFPADLTPGTAETIQLVYEGKPRIAVRPPWDGGWIFTRDRLGRPWMSVACQGLGASVWYPCKDHQSDEPDSAFLDITVPDTLVAVGNGRLVGTSPAGEGITTWSWAVKNPINNYNIIPYIGKYVHWEETFDGLKGPLDCSYWVLDYELEKAKAQFLQVPKMLKCFEHWFGPYPFYEDGFKMVQAPHLGMEHQGAIAYGNGFQNGYRGRDLSESGWGLKWDFIIVHESGHEWFGNNITSDDIGDMWIHESFTNYSETIFTTCEYGVEAGNDYVIGTRPLIKNDIPIIGAYGVNEEGSGDMYYKGGNMIHTIRQLVRDDEKFRMILTGLNKTFYHQTVTTAQVEQYISRESGMNLSKVFDQYLRNTKIPSLEYRLKGKRLYYRWTNVIPGFNMPVKVKLDESGDLWLTPLTRWQRRKLTSTPRNLETDRNFYVMTSRVN